MALFNKKKQKTIGNQRMEEGKHVNLIKNISAALFKKYIPKYIYFIILANINCKAKWEPRLKNSRNHSYQTQAIVKYFQNRKTTSRNDGKMIKEMHIYYV